MRHKDDQLNVRVPAWVKAEIRAAADRRGVKPAVVAREALTRLAARLRRQRGK